jgi:UDP-glucuronate 4-epimerase
MINPYAYIDTNIKGFLNVLESSSWNNVKHFIFASSSSVYGSNKKTPFSVNDTTDHPISLYGATKKSNEMIAHSYSSMYGLPCSGLRFFSVYGPYGRPDLALFIFTKNILEGKSIDIFGDGTSTRAYTYIDDVVDCIIKTIEVIPDGDKYWKPESSTSIYPYKIYNVGSNKPVELNKFISLIEDNLKIKADKNYIEPQIGDIIEAFSDNDNNLFQFKVPVEVGVANFVSWFKSYYSYN